MAHIVAIGGAHIDRTGRLDAPHRPGASNPGRWQTLPGGGVFNAARNLSRLGHHVTLVSPRGGDGEAELVAAAAHAAGIDDRPLTFLDRATPTYTAILEPDGNLVTALADMALYDTVSPRRLQTSRFLALLDQAEMVICDANLPAETLAALGQATKERQRPLAAIAISPAKVVRLAGLAGRLDWLFMNINEHRAFSALAGAHAPASQVVTDGSKTVSLIRPDLTVTRTPPPCAVVRDVTGAGDALAAGFLDAVLSGYDQPACLERGIALAQMTLGVAGPVDEGLTAEALAHFLSTLRFT